MSTAIMGILCTIGGTALCAVAQLAAKKSNDFMPITLMCAIRYAIATVLCYPVMVKYSGSWIPAVTLDQAGFAVLISVIAWGFGAVLFFVTMDRDSMHRVAPVSNSLSVWTVILSILFLGEPFFPALAVVLVILTLGIAFMGPEARTTKRWKWAVPGAVGVSILWAVSIVLTKVTIHDINYSVFVLIKLAAATVFHFIATFFDRGGFDRRGLKFIAISAATLVMGDTLLMAGLDMMPASIFAPVFATIIPFGFIGSVFLLGEKPVRRNWVGMALIFAAAAICGYIGAR